MLKLQDMVKEEKLDNVEFISFSVDPAVDTPEVLREYGERFSVDFSSWNFLTGYKQEEIEAFAMDTFKTIVKKPEEGDQVIHQSYFYLVDQNGNIMKSYSGLNDTPFEDIIKDIKTLQ
jgi:protein SCO1/2